MIVDFRSDTVTKPTAAMLDAMFTAQVGDDVYGEDETVNALEEKLAELFGMQAGLFCPSGTMANQIAIKCLTQPLDEVICEETSHVYKSEGGGMAFHSAVSAKPLRGSFGKLTAEFIEPHINPTNIHYPNTKLVVLENTSNWGGGSYYTLNEIEPIYHLCQLKKMYLHLDGARIFNALVKTGEAAKSYGHLFDSISVCLSKGLGAPVGSVLLGSIELIHKAKRIRKVLGGGMRQAGYLAAAAIFALDNHITRLKDDHEHAKIISDTLMTLPVIKNIYPVHTNIVIAELDKHISADIFVERLLKHGIKSSAFDNNLVRFVTHLGVSAAAIDYSTLWLKKEFH